MSNGSSVRLISITHRIDLLNVLAWSDSWMNWFIERRLLCTWHDLVNDAKIIWWLKRGRCWSWLLPCSQLKYSNFETSSTNCAPSWLDRMKKTLPTWWFQSLLNSCPCFNQLTLKHRSKRRQCCRCNNSDLNRIIFLTQSDLTLSTRWGYLKGCYHRPYPVQKVLGALGLHFACLSCKSYGWLRWISRFSLDNN